MKRIALVCAVISVLLVIDGLYMEIARYHPDDQNTFFGNQNLVLSDGQVTLISAGFFILATIIISMVAGRRDTASPGRGAEPEHDDRRTASKS